VSILVSKVDIKNAGLRVTGPRVLVLSALQQSEEHMTAEQVYQRIYASGQEIGLATVYRALQQLEQSKLILRHQFGDKGAVYECDNGHHHDHLLCVICGEIIEFFSEPLEMLQVAIAKEYDFSLESHNLVMYGTCRHCQTSS